MVSKLLLHWIYGSEPYVKHTCTSHECCKHSICIHMWCHLLIIIYGTLLLAHAMSCIVALSTLIVVCPQLSCSHIQAMHFVLKMFLSYPFSDGMSRTGVFITCMSEIESQS